MKFERASLAALTGDSFIGYVTADAEVRDFRSIYIVSTVVNDASVSLRVSAPRYPIIPPGTFVRVSGDISRAKSFETEGGGLFEYESFLRARSVVALVDNASLDETDIKQNDHVVSFVPKHFASVVHVTSKLESRLVESVNSILGRREGALVLGMTLGRKDDLDEAAQDDFKKSGLMHIVVLSGSNVAIVVSAMSTIISKIFSGRTLGARASRAMIPVMGAWMLVLASGADPSARRAGFMSTVSIFSNQFSQLNSSSGSSNETKKLMSSNSSDTLADRFMMLVAGDGGWRQLAVLSATAAFMSIINPYAPYFDPSYGLSFLAAFGVTFLAPVLSRLFRFLPERFAVRETISQCVAAQIATYPIISRMGSNQSWLALVANVTAAPLVPLAMASGAAVGLINLFSFEAALPFAIVATAVTRAIYAIAFFAAAS